MFFIFHWLFIANNNDWSQNPFHGVSFQSKGPLENIYRISKPHDVITELVRISYCHLIIHRKVAIKIFFSLSKHTYETRLAKLHSI